MMDDNEEAETPRPRRVWRWIGGVLLILLVSFGALSVVSIATRETSTETLTFPAGDVSAIVADLGAGTIDIVAEARGDVSVTIVSRSTVISAPDPVAEVGDGTLRLTGECRLFLTFSCGVDFEVAVPIGSVLAVEVTMSAGSTNIVRIGGTIDATTSAGDITVTDFAGDRATLAVSAGNVTFSAVTPPTELRASARAGNVRISVPDAGYRVETDTAAGNATVEVRTDPASSRVISAETSAGNIEITVP
jgi:Putative adhesin